MIGRAHIEGGSLGYHKPAILGENYFLHVSVAKKKATSRLREAYRLKERQTEIYRRFKR